MKSTIIRTVALVVFSGMAMFAMAQVKKPTVFYCKYCGHKASSIASLTSSICTRHPDGACKGRHVLYDGSEKREYTCKYCGKKSPSISSLTASLCMRHPNGPAKGKHAPAM